MSEKRNLTYEKIAETEDTGDSVIRAEFQDTKSRADIIVCDGRIRVWYIESNMKGDMKKILDDVTSQLGVYDVDFLEPDTSKILGERNLQDILDDFTRHEEIVESPNGKVKSIYLRGKWQKDNL